VILASDTRGSWANNQISAHEECGKQWDFPYFAIAASVAGSMGAVQPFVDQLTVQIASFGKRKRIYCEHFENAIDYSRFRLFLKRVDWRLKMYMGMSFKEWRTAKTTTGEPLSYLILRAGLKFFDTTSLPIQAIIAGFLNDGRLIFYKADQKADIDQSTSPGVLTIGTASVVAMDHLMQRGQNADCSLARSLLHVHEALKKARRTDQYVGRPSAYFVIRKNGQMGRFPADSRLLRNWAKVYGKRKTTWSLQNSKLADEHVLGLVMPHVRRETEFVK
jgi:hypothetical protein